MHDTVESLDVVLPVDDQPPKRGRPIVAWVVIVLLVIFIYIRGVIRTEERVEAGEDRIGLTVMELQSKYCVGAVEYFGRQAASAPDNLNAGPIDQRLRYVILEGELSGPSKAVALLLDLDKKVAEQGKELTPKQQTLRDILGRLYHDYAAGNWDDPSLSAANRDWMRQELGWFGKLALNPAQGPDPEAREAVLRQAKKTVWVLLTLFVGVVFLGLAGLIGLVVVLVCFATGALRASFATGSPYGGIYAETFAVWMALFILLGLGASYLPAVPSSLLLQGLVSLLSLSALLWPVIRGVPWRQVRHDIGLKWSRRPAREPAVGAAGYVMTIPAVAIAAIGMLILIAIWQRLRAGSQDPFAPTGQPAHPIVQYVAAGSWWVPIQILVLACVVAPIVEETMFRGVLYRHLREASAKWGSGLSVLISAVTVSFVFAVIHPQGLFAVPVLMTLAIGFNLLREWRGTLLPCMVAHGLNNGLITLMMIVALR